MARSPRPPPWRGRPLAGSARPALRSPGRPRAQLPVHRPAIGVDAGRGPRTGRCCAARSSASACALDASRNSRSPAVSSSSAVAAQSRAAPSRAPVELVVRAARRCHSWAAGDKCRRTAPPGGVVVQPAGQPRPSGQQRLVRDVEPLAVERQQPPRHEAVHHRPAHGRGHRPGRARRAAPAAGWRATLVGVGQPPAGRPGAARRRARPRPRPTCPARPSRLRPPGNRRA